MAKVSQAVKDQEALGLITEREKKRMFLEPTVAISAMLEMYQDFYFLTLTEIGAVGFTDNEICLMVDVTNGTMISSFALGYSLMLNVEDGIALEGLDKKWSVDKDSLLNKLKSLSGFHRVVIEVLAHNFWYGADGQGGRDLSDEALQGLVNLLQTKPR